MASNLCLRDVNINVLQSSQQSLVIARHNNGLQIIFLWTSSNNKNQLSGVTHYDVTEVI